MRSPSHHHHRRGSISLVQHQDPSSLSNHTEAQTTHLTFRWSVDFGKESITGEVVHYVQFARPGVGTVVFDSKGLDIASVEVCPATTSSDTVEWRGLDEHRNGDYIPATYAISSSATRAMGEGLVVTLPPSMGASATSAGTAPPVLIRIRYRTVQKHCTALCWLTASQTESKELPFFYSQCQAIHARTLFPCMDTPSVRASFWAEVDTSAPGAMVLMSALAAAPAATSMEGSSNGNNSLPSVFTFHQPNAVPSYLVAIAAGRIASIDVSNRCRVYAEPTMVKRAAWEFAEVEHMLGIAEWLAGPYEWERYDLLVLPPSFPFGGMENPNLTFVTPTCITGDRSLVELIAHEICHSWSGNLVGIASWSDFWINEGFTTFLQRKITLRMHDQDVADFEAGTGVLALQDSVRGYGETHNFTRLIPELTRDIDPDDAFSSVPYEKGYLLLVSLERKVGEAAFGAWIKDQYIPAFRHRSITSTDVKNSFSMAFPDASRTVDWEKEFRAVGMPPLLPPLSTVVRDECDQLADAILNADRVSESVPFPDLSDVKNTWQGRQHVSFLERLLTQLQQREDGFVEPLASSSSTNPATTPSPTEAAKRSPPPPNSARSSICGVSSGHFPPWLSEKALGHIDDAFDYSGSFPNYEVRHAWFLLALRSRGEYRRHRASMLAFLKEVGRMKFVRDVFSAWAAFEPNEARQHFDECCSGYHAVTRKMIEQDLQV